MNSKQKKTLIYVGIGVLVAGLLVWWWFRDRAPVPDDTIVPASSPTGSTPVYSSSSTSSSWAPFSPDKTVDVGSTGETVKYIQLAVNRYRKLKNLPLIDTDGKYGSAETKPAVIGLMGRTAVTYNQVKAKVIQEFELAGKPNPYTSSTSSSSSASTVAYQWLLPGGIDGSFFTIW